MRLEEHQIAAMAFGFRVEEVIEAGLEEIGCTGIAGNVAAEFPIGVVGAHDHSQRVPADQCAQALLDGEVAGKGRLVVHGDGVDVGGDAHGRPADSLRLGQAGQLVEHPACARGTLGCDQCREGVSPFGCLLGVGVGNAAVHE